MRSRGIARTVVALVSALVVTIAWWATFGRHDPAEGADRCAATRAGSDARARMVTGAGPLVVVIGDSWSTGHGMRDVARSWPSYLPGRVEVHGFNGSGFAAHASECPGEAFADRVPRSAAHASLVVLEGGLNDFNQPTVDITTGFRRTVSRLENLHVDASRIVVLGPPRAPARVAGAARAARLMHAECVRAGVRYISTSDLRIDYLPDRLHPTAAGHREFGEAVARLLGAR